MHFDFWPSRLPKTQAWRAQEPVFWGLTSETWGDLRCQTLRPEPIKKTRLPKTQPSKQRNSMAWRTQEARFLTCAGVIFSVKRCGRNLFKKETIFAASGLTSGLISHLDLALRRTSTSDWKDFPTTLPSGQGNSMAWRQGFPKRSLQNSETAWPGELKEPIFWPVLGWSSVSNVAAGTAKKETICAAAGLTSETCAGVIFNVKRCGRNR